MAASEEEHKVNVDRAKRPSLPTRPSRTVPDTTATCEDGMVPEDDHPEVGLFA